MKPFGYMTLLAAVAGISAGCQRMEEMRTYEPGDVVPPVLNPLDIDAITVTDENLDETVTFVWDAADFGVRAQINYSLEAEYEDSEAGETRRTVIQSGISATSLEMTYENLNYTVGLSADLGGLGVPLDTPEQVRFYVGASVGNSDDIYWSEPQELTMTVIYAEPRYPNVWVIGKYSNWDHARSQFLFSFGNNAEYEGIVDFGENAAENNGGTADDVGFKLTGAANWNNATGNWGVGADRPEAEAEEITLVNNGGNIANVFSKRYYSLAYNTTSLVLVRQYAFDRLMVYGTAVGEDEQTMLFNTSDQKFWLDATLTEGTLNFALADGTERTVLGSATEGILDSENPIAAPAGNYRIYVNLNNSDERTYEFNADDYGKEIDEEEEITDPTGHTWGIAGTMNNWGNEDSEGETEPDLAMVLDGDYYVRRNVALTVSDEFKIRFDNEWEDEDNVQTNYGASDAENGLTLRPAEGSAYMGAALVLGGGGNISVNADGTYDIYFNADQGYIHVRPAGSDAPGDITWGLVGSFTGWTPGEDWLMTAAEGEGQEYYIYEGLELTEPAQLKFRYGNMFKDGGDNVYGLPSGTAGEVALDEPVNLDADGSAANLEIPAGTYDLVLYPDQRVVYIISGADVNVPDRITWGICGSMTGWADNMDKLMTESDGYYVLENQSLTAGAEFKFRYGNNWNGDSYGYDSGVRLSASDDAVALVYGGGDDNNIVVAEDGNYDLYLAPSYGFAYIKEHGADAPGAVSFGIQAGITDGLSDLTMSQSGSDFVCTNVRFPDSDSFRIRVSNNDGLVFGGTSSGTNTVITAEVDGPAISVLPGIYNIYFNYDRREIRIEGNVDEPRWGIVGTFNGWTNDRLMTEEDGFFVYRGLSFETDNVADANGGNSNAFKLRKGWSWDSGNVGVPGNGPVEISVNTGISVINDGGSKDLIVPEAGTYDIWFDESSMKLYVMEEGKTPADAENPDTPEPGQTYFIRGEAFGWDAGREMTDAGTHAILTGIDAADLKQSFKLYDSAAKLWYGRGGGDTYIHPIPVGKAVELYNNNNNSEGQSNVRLDENAEAGTYDVWFFYPSGTGEGDTGTIYIVKTGETPAI